jgi:hypothetical protein
MNADMKVFEIRDRGTCIPWLAFKFAYPMSERSVAILRRAGFGDRPQESDCVIQGPAHCSGGLEDEKLIYNSTYVKNDRCRMAAMYIKANFDTLESGQVIDICVILGEATEPAASDL